MRKQLLFLAYVETNNGTRVANGFFFTSNSKRHVVTNKKTHTSENVLKSEILSPACLHRSLILKTLGDL